MSLSPYTGEPPLDSDARWVSISVLAELLYERLRHGPDVARDLYDALGRGRLRCKARSMHTGEPRLMASAEWAALKLIWWGIDPERREHTVTVEKRVRDRWAYQETVYIWRPDFEALWPAGNVTPATSKLSPGAWFAKALKDHPQQPGKHTGDYAGQLYQLMQADAANLTKVWKLKTFKRRLNEANEPSKRKPRSQPKKH